MDSTTTPENGAPLRAIALAGATAGVLDITYVIVFYAFRGVAPSRILQSIAAALLGRSAFNGGFGVAALGLAMHFGVAFSAAAVFYVASRRFPVMTRRPIAAGLVYGVAVWLLMNLVVLPLSATPPRSFPPPQWIPVFIAHLVCVGIPIAIVVRRARPAPATLPS